jgi:sigma-B regulation protein RsbU (phosphoserine phosphatase)
MGLVIADVADKGMPAALFMTLVRTLVRATALQANRPEQVLERVNDLLVPDAPQGMFVTLAYAVLNLETGELEYANAGHNPPLLLRNRSCDLTPFERTGMALGVLEGNHIEGRRIQLEQEDFVIMYTDGVTEAFSPQGEIFGEQRLFETILDVVNSDSAHVVDAQTVLERIDWAVSDFVDEATVSDDLTLVILKCTRH